MLYFKKTEIVILNYKVILSFILLKTDKSKSKGQRKNNMKITCIHLELAHL